MELKKVVKYRIMYSSKCILDEDSIKSKMTEVVHEYPESIEENINKNLKTGNLENTLAEFRLFMDYVQAMDVDNFLMSLSRLAISINKTVNQININRIGEISLNFNEFFIAISSAETIDDIKSEFCNLIVLINEQQEETTQTRNHHIAQLIIEYIEQNYNDKSLNLKELASNFKISYGYMLLIFKESQNQSLPEYLNMVRLKKAAELLCTTGDSVSKIMNNVGYDNESNFYRLFKKHFGATPRQYRINRTAAQKSNST
jgi:YesN/AraC family two-component response regulator